MIWFKRGLAAANILGAFCGFMTVVSCVRLGDWRDAAIGLFLTIVGLVVALGLVLPRTIRQQEGPSDGRERVIQ